MTPDNLPIQSKSSVTTNLACACAECGYNLRTLDKNGRCPECGWPITKSLAASNNCIAKLFAALLLASIAPWLFGRWAAALMPAREGLPAVALLFSLAVLAMIIILIIGQRMRRRCGRHRFGLAGIIAMMLTIAVGVTYTGIIGFVIYLAQDTTFYAPGFNHQAFHRINAGLSRRQVEQIIGKPLLTYTEDGDEVARYSKQTGFYGWKYLVIYNNQDKVKQTVCRSYAD